MSAPIGKSSGAPLFFLDIDPRTAADPGCPYVVLPLPYEKTVTYGSGTAAGPAAILRASREVEDFDEELLLKTDLRAHTLQAPRLDWDGLERNMSEIRHVAEPLFRAGKFLLALGGEHTVSFPLVQAAISVHGPVTALCLDAHLDLRNEYEGAGLSHACAMRRIRDTGMNTVHVGTRSYSAEEHDYVCAHGVPVTDARSIRGDPAGKWIENTLSELRGKVYVSVDVDVFDPSFVPGTGTPEPGGLDWRHVTGLLRRVFAEREVVGADIVELAPVPGTQASEFTAARLGAKMLTYHRYRDRLL